MDFLRTSGNDNSRERKSWGSLGKTLILLYFISFSQQNLVLQTDRGQEEQEEAVPVNVLLYWVLTFQRKEKDQILPPL